MYVVGFLMQWLIQMYFLSQQLILLLYFSDEKLRNKRHTYVFSATLTLLHSGPQRVMKKKKKIKLDEKQKLGIHLLHILLMLKCIGIDKSAS